MLDYILVIFEGVTKRKEKKKKKTAAGGIVIGMDGVVIAMAYITGGSVVGIVVVMSYLKES